MKRILVKVKAKDIKNGHNNYCPVELALLRALPGCHPTVCEGVIEVQRVGYRDQVNEPCPSAVTRFIQRFDSRKEVKPFNFYFKLS